MAKKTTTTKGLMLTYPVLGKLRHDGERLVEGDTVELTETQAAPLLANGTIGSAITAKPGKEEAPTA